MEIASADGSRGREEVSRLGTSKRLPVRWTASASADLIEILEFIGADRPAAAREVGRGVLQQAITLGRNSLRERIVPELFEQRVTDYRQIMVSRYRVIYRVHSPSKLRP